MLRVGLTGGIGSGKSTVADFFAALGVPVIDTDVIAHELVTPDQPAYREIVDHFGNDVVCANGMLDRTKLRARVFDDAGARERLESFLHPRIRAEVKRRLDQIKNDYAIIVVPLLIETGFNGLIDRILVVDADEALQIERVAKRSRMTAVEIKKIMAVQATRGQRLMRADDVVENNGTPAELEQQITKLHRHYLSIAGS